MTTFFTADTHFGHANIIKYCHRPFGSAAKMDHELIRRWNSVVGDNDIVWHLGDFCFGNESKAKWYLDKLRGRIGLIWGNHDSNSVRDMPEWTFSGPYREINLDGQHITLCHYALRVWNRSHYGSLSLFGHTHGTLAGNQQSVDVGVDYPAWNYTPITLNQITEHLKTLQPRTKE